VQNNQHVYYQSVRCHLKTGLIQDDEELSRHFLFLFKVQHKYNKSSGFFIILLEDYY